MPIDIRKIASRALPELLKLVLDSFVLIRGQDARLLYVAKLSHTSYVSEVFDNGVARCYTVGMPIRPDYEMFTDSGNEAIHLLVEDIRDLCSRNLTRAAVVKILTDNIVVIHVKHPEVRDTAVREAICYALDDAFDKAGFSRLNHLEDL